MAFVQIVEFQTTKPDEIRAMDKEWRAATEGRRTATRSLHVEDRDRPGTYCVVVEFPSFEAAMKNSELPETAGFATKMAALCDGPMTFRNLEVIEEQSL